MPTSTTSGTGWLIMPAMTAVGNLILLAKGASLSSPPRPLGLSESVSSARALTLEVVANIGCSTGSEHFWLYQIAYNGAKNVMSTLFQSESKYTEGQKARPHVSNTCLPTLLS